MASGGQTFGGKDILKNRLYFPAFQDLGDENDLDDRYWEEKYEDSEVWVQSCTWCFLGEITNDEFSQTPFLRNKVLVRDRVGKDNINISFYPERGIFDFTTLKKGHTICVMLAEKHYFLDMTIGLRIEGLDTVKVIPCGLDDLFKISAFYSRSQGVCWGCEKKASAGESGGGGGACGSAALKRCAACLTASYCSKECQRKDWKERHRRWCRALLEFVKMTKIDYTKYDEHALFGLFSVGRIW